MTCRRFGRDSVAIGSMPGSPTCGASPSSCLSRAVRRVGCASPVSPLVEAPRLAARLGLERLWVKDDSRNPTLSFKDRVVAVAAARAAEWGFHTLACASTGNLSAAVAAAAAARGLRAVVFVPAELETAKVAQARALGATLVRVDGPYDEVNRLCLELTDELEGWAFLNVNLRPFYAEGSKTIAFEIAQQLGWRTPDVVVAPLASGLAVHEAGARLSGAGGRRPAGRGARALPGWSTDGLRAHRHRLR